MDEGTSFTIDLPVTGQTGIDAAAASVDTLEVRLESASNASRAAAAALKVGADSYKAAETTADKAAKALERIGIAADAQRGKYREALAVGDMSAADRAAVKLGNLFERQAEAADKATAAKTALEAEAAALDKLQKAADKAAAEESKLGKEKQEKPKAEEAGEGEGFDTHEFAHGLGKLGGPLGEVGEKVARLTMGFDKLKEGLGIGGPAAAAAIGVVVLVAAVVKLTEAVIDGIKEFGEWVLELTEANTKASLLAQGIARSVEGGEMLDATMSDLTKTLPLTREELQGMAQKLADSGLRGKALSEQLDKTALAAAKLKFGPDFEEQMLSLDEQSKVFHQNLAGIFGGLKIDGLLSAIQKLIGLFDESSASGKAIKVVFESIFQPLVDKLAEAEPKIERFFLHLEILALKALIAIKPYGSWFVKFGEVLLVVAAIVGGVLLAAVVTLVAFMAMMAAPIIAAVAAVMYLGSKAIEVFNSISDWWKSVNLADMGKAMIDGLIGGITSRATALISSVKITVDGAVSAAKKALGIASPSKVFAEIGMQTGAGMEAGVTRSSGGVRASLESMVSPPSSGAASASTSQGSSSKGGNTVDLKGAKFNFYGVEGAEDAEKRFADMLTRVMEGDAAQLGAMAAPAK